MIHSQKAAVKVALTLTEQQHLLDRLGDATEICVLRNISKDTRKYFFGFNNIGINRCLKLLSKRIENNEFEAFICNAKDEEETKSFYSSL